MHTASVRPRHMRLIRPPYPFSAMNWMHGGKLLRTHRIPLVSTSQALVAPRNPADEPAAAPASAIPTSIALDDAWLVVGLANSRIHVFSAKTGVLSRTLVGHESGVWAVALVRGTQDDRAAPHVDDAADGDSACDDDDGPNDDPSSVQDPPMPPTLRRALGLDIGSPGGDKRSRRRSASDVFSHGKGKARTKAPPPVDKPSDPTGSSDGWGQPNALVVSGGCDKELRVWDVKSG